MKKIIILFAFLAVTFTSCYKDNATFTVEVGGSDETYLVSYKNQQGEMVDNVTVPKGWQYWDEHSEDFQLILKVTGATSESEIEVKVYKRAKLIKTFIGTGELMIDEKINH